MMEMNTYIIRITTRDNLYADYMVEAANIFFAKMRARNAFFRDYPEADNKIKLSLQNLDTMKIREILDIIREAN